MLEELHIVLKTMDDLLGRYPVYLYLENSSGQLIWSNRFLNEDWPELASTEYPTDFFQVERTVITTTDAEYPEQIRKFQVRRDIPDMHEHYVEFLKVPVLNAETELDGSLHIGVDVTDSESARRILREKRKLFTAIVDTSTDAIILVDLDEKIIGWNRGAEEIFGFQHEEVLNHDIRVMIPDSAYNSGENEHFKKELMTHGSVKDYETVRLHKNGKQVHVDISATLIHDGNGKEKGYSQIIKSIDSRKQLEFELLRTILELSKLNELNDILYSTYDENEILRIILIAITAGEGLRFNRAFVVMLDEEEQSLKGRLAIGPSDREEANRIWKELDQESRQLRDIVRLYNIEPDGTDRKVNEIVRRINVPLTDSEHVLIRALNEKRVFQVEEKAILGGGHCAFAVGQSDLFAILQHHTFVVAPIYAKNDLLGVIIADNGINLRRIGKEDVEGLKLFAHQASRAIENARLYFNLENRISQLQDANRSIAENQQKLLRAERLATIGEMSAKIAHEIRNPLVSIGGFARLIERKTGENKDLKQYAGIISEQVLHLEHILNNILSMSKPLQGEKTRVDINEIVDQVANILSQAMTSRKIGFDFERADQSLWVEGDAKMLHQALMNIVKNAIEALEGIGDERKIRVVSRQINQFAELNISDTGPGIDTGVLTKIFQTFFTTKSSGTGLGLAIVRQIVETHKGTVDVHTQPGKGTTFLLRFPLLSEEDKPRDEEVLTEKH